MNVLKFAYIISRLVFYFIFSKLERETVGKVAEETPYSVGDSVVAFVSQVSCRIYFNVYSVISQRTTFLLNVYNYMSMELSTHYL